MPKNAPIAEATLYGLPPAPRPEGEPAPGSGSEPPRPARPSEGFVRAVAVVSLVATVLGVLVLPGLLGSVPEAQAVWGERVTAMTGYLAFAGLLLLTSTFGYELILRAELGAPRYVLLALSVVVVGLAAPSLSSRLIAIPQALLAFVAAVLAIVASAMSLRAPHTRAPSFVLGMVGVSGLLRALGWSVASLAGDGSVSVGASRTLSTLGVVAMGTAQLVAVAYFATRGKVQGRVVANVALVLGFVVTYLAARRPPFAGPLGAILGASLARGAPSPEPYLLGPVAHYLLPTGIFLGVVALVQRGQVVAIAAGLALALASQGRLDVPMPALFCLIAGLLLVRASRDDRAMWTDLITTRAQRRADDGDGDARPPVPRNVVVERRSAPRQTPEREAPAAEPAEEQRVEEPKGEEPKGEEPKPQQPKPEEPKAEEPKAEEPKAEEREDPKGEEPKGEEPESEAPRDPR